MSDERPEGPLAERVALVTGAAGLLGRATVEAIVAAGGRVLATDLDAHGLAGTARAIQASGDGDAVRTVVADIAAPEAPADLVASAVAAFGSLDLVVHCAVVGGSRPIGDWTAEEWDRMHAVNVRAAGWLAGAAAPHLEASGHGAVVLFSSIQAERGVVGSAVYAATKGAIESLTRHLAAELGPRGIRVNAIAPGWVRREIPADISAFARPGRPEEVASVIVFLASDGASWMNGTVLPVDGGASVVHPPLSQAPAPTQVPTAPAATRRVRRLVRPARRLARRVRRLGR